MTTPDAPRDLTIELPHGSIFSRRWSPPDAGIGAGAAPAGQGAAPIVMLHDSLGSVELWRDFPARLAQATRRDVIAYDRLGFGRSDARTEAPSADFVAEEATDVFPVLRRAWGLSRFVLFGHSVGGGMAVHIAARSGTDCEALVTVAAQAFVEDRTLAGIRDAQRLFEDPVQFDRLARYHGPRTRWVLDAWIHRWLDPAFAGWSLRDVLPQLRCPLLAIHGELDEYGSTRHPQMLARHTGGPSTVAILPQTAHVPHRERPDAVLQQVTAFLEKTA